MKPDQVQQGDKRDNIQDCRYNCSDEKPSLFCKDFLEKREDSHTQTNDFKRRHQPNKPPEIPVILLSHTIIQPGAMMVKMRRALVANPAVLRRLVDKCVADTAPQVEVVSVLASTCRLEPFLHRSNNPLLLDNRVLYQSSCDQIVHKDNRPNK